MADILYKYGMKLIPKGNHSLQFRKPKMEIGTVATDWSPAPEDPDADLLERINVLQTDFQVVQGEIQAKVWETDIEKATDGLYESMNEMYAYIDETINGISAEVGDLTFTVENNYYTLTEQISDLVITTDSITGMVRDTQQTIDIYYDELTGEIISNYNTTMDLIASIQIEADSITSTVANIQTTVENLINPINILLYTDKMNMTVPWQTYNSESSRLTSWTIYTGSGLPAGSNYAHSSPSNWSSMSGFSATAFHWSVDDDIIYEHIDQLSEGEIYTFSFYLQAISAKTSQSFYIWVHNCLYGQTILGSNREIHNDGPSPSGFDTDYIEVPAQIARGTWERVSITFRLDNLNDFRLGISFGSSDGQQPQIDVCGLMLTPGSVLCSWDDGETSAFATTKFVYSQIEQLSDSITTTVGNLEDQLTSQIQQTADSITSDVNNIADGLESEIKQLSDSITATVTNLESSMQSQIEQLAGSIKLSVTSATNGSASIVMTVDGSTAGSGTVLPNGVRTGFANDTTAITISAGTVTFNSNTFVVNSTYFSVTASGVITATSGTIGGWTISDVALRNGPATILNSTDGVILQSPSTGYGGLRVNNGNLGVRLMSGYEDFIYSGTVSGYITGATNFSNTTGDPGVRIGGYGGFGLFAPVLIVGTTYYSAGVTAYGSTAFTGSYQVIINIVDNGNGTITWTYTNMVFVNGIFTG